MSRLRIVLLILVSLFVFSSCGYFWRALVYQKVDIDDYKIFPNRMVEAGEHEPWAKSTDYNSYTLSDTTFEQAMALKSVAYLVIQDGKILYENYWDNYTDSSWSNSFSAAKSIVSLLVGVAIEEGHIGSVNDRVSKYVTEYDNETNRDLRIKDVLTMSSGLNWHEAYANPWSKTTKAYYGRKLEKMILKLKMKSEPGKYFHYFSGDTELLAIILRRATGMSLADYASEKLWKKIEAKHDALWSLDHEGGIEKAYCCFNSNARDFARIGQLVLNDGSWDGAQVVPEDWLEQSLKPADHLLTEDEKKPVDFYGYQWWMVNHQGHMTYYARGLAGQYIFIVPDLDMVIVRLGHKRSKERVNNLPSDIYLWLDTGFKIAQTKNAQ
ncbi:6-aminohexanoate-dimer hydrolase [Salinivirga cyanobacteriivorans]|uniref:6-aminohexanoate-dimer hydrolase n=1 Tax=Salinivirga cyanobacteriivorans TaxID=1307839 RepID=A0A0S2I4P7_9BACT|nr:serine hydrolase [Salinivirga cyanobacteriivorans]ALO17296.1 6-aminohexanoate-dimer hydrolase [Salinivirga cyanobacteriivorans]